MSEERLNLIKENVYTRCSIANITGIGMTALDKEEVELIEEIERLNNIINELEHKLYQEWLEWKDSDCESIYVRTFEDKSIYDYIQELKGSDKE